MNKKIETGVVLDDRIEITLSELCKICGGHAEWIMELISEGIIDEVRRDGRRWRFSGASAYRAKTAMRLQRDLGLNLPGVALALELLDEMEHLRAKVRRIEQAEKHR